MPFQAGERPTADAFNALVTGRARITLTVAPQTLTSGSTTKINLDTVVYDDAGFWDGAGYLVRIPAGMGGLYAITGSISYTSNATGRRACDIQSTAYGRLSSTILGSIAGDTRYSTSTQYVLVPGDEVWLNGYQQSGADLNVLGTATNVTHLAIARLQPI